MKQYSGGKKGNPKAYYKCSVSKCEETATMIKTRRESVVPPTPVTCPRCSTDKKPVYCSRNKKRSTGAYVILTCPDCQWNSNSLALPMLAAQHYESRQRAVVPMIGDR